ncbi:carbohydrate ABC transporter permease [Natronosporangium hydrolyticum]|uniref:Carbohydrate ABC transporter permease n=1 Tax=Natronosporangium hydrolyticum TaxID=2811111 RepID=A0A895YCW6_9ACTN|nr:carbohydrate ABC transporter permease [Natronosporangium hydrolyticum]QSB15361.1 carbohydrate ABC transporter permease [Natronosporangium hydrolyticum]
MHDVTTTDPAPAKGAAPEPPAITAAERRRRRAARIRAVVMWSFIALYLFPVYWMISTSLKPMSDVATVPPVLVPTDLYLGAFESVLSNSAFLQSMRTSAIVATGTMVLGLFLAVPAAYGLARWRGRGAEVSSLSFIMAQLLPTIVIATPLFVLFASVGLTNSHLGLIIANTTIVLPFAVIILRPFFAGLPAELEDAARLDGCNPLQTLIRVAIPLARGGIVTIASLSFILTWGDLVFGLTLVTDPALRPITATLTEFVTEYTTYWNLLMAGAAVASAPILLTFLLLQRYIVGGLMDGALK